MSPKAIVILWMHDMCGKTPVTCAQMQRCGQKAAGGEPAVASGSLSFRLNDVNLPVH
ncbi:MAG: hypothetical protein RLZZ536_1580 [Planctomycetota bacterium]|jgi:hypothetical protein